MTVSKQLITVLIPAYNEEEVLPHLMERLGKLTSENADYTWEILFVNDGSRDRTQEMIRGYAKDDDRISYVNLSRNFGKEIAMIAGIDHVRGDALIILDADLQDPPELIPEMIKHWQQGYDDVYAKRSVREGETWFKIFTANTFYWIMNKLTRSQLITIPGNTGDFRLLDRRCVEALKQMRESERYTKGMYSWVGFNKKEITYNRDARVAGSPKQNYRKLFDLAFNGITSFSTSPLRIASVMGIVISLVAFIFIVVVVVKTLLFGDPVAGYPSTMAAILFLGGLQLLSIGIIGEYVGKIFMEVKDRPLYLIDEYHSGKSGSHGTKDS